MYLSGFSRETIDGSVSYSMNNIYLYKMGFIRVTGNDPTIPIISGNQWIIQESSVQSTRLDVSAGLKYTLKSQRSRL